MTNSTSLFDWNKIGANYENDWTSAKEYFSGLEIAIIQKYLAWKLNILEYGIWTGRILEHTLRNKEDRAKVSCMDIAPSMINYCKSKFHQPLLTFALYTWVPDLEKLNAKFDYIYAVRSIKYDPEWELVISALSKKIEPNGIFAISMPNPLSINYFYRPTWFYRKVSRKTLLNMFNTLWFKLVEIDSFSKLPNLLYKVDNVYFQRIVTFLEMLLRKSLWWALWGREVFYVFQKNID